MFASAFLLTTDKRFRAHLVGVFVAVMVIAGSMAYEVQRGDTLWEIAQTHGVTLQELLAVNDIPNPDLIRPGQQITIPGDGGSAATVHVVAHGETLSRIAAKYDASANEIARNNSLSNPNFIRVGQELTIPGIGSSQATSTPSPTASGFHVVARGETLSSIGARYGLTAAQVAEANGMSVNSIVYVGARLQLAGSTFVAPSVSGGASLSHTVTAGQTLSQIAASYGVSAGDIARASSVANVNRIVVGQKLNIPGAAGWVCPVNGGQYVNDWGFPRNGGRFHEGTDLFAPRGAEVVAPVSGTLQPIIGTVGGFQFRLYGDDGATYIGTHMDAFGRTGRVEAGEVIGYVGDTGNARGGPTHLHFEIHPGDGAAVNPFTTLQKAGC